MFCSKRTKGEFNVNLNCLSAIFEFLRLDERSKCIKLLVDNGAKVNTTTCLGSSALIMAVENNRLSSWKTLIDAGADIHHCRMNGHSAFQVGTARTRKEFSDFVVKQHWGYPLHLAVFKANINEARSEIISGLSDINSRNINDWTPLHLASFSNRIEMVMLLLEYGADTSCKTDKGHSALHLACSKGNVEITQLLTWLPSSRPGRAPPASDSSLA